MRATLLQSCTCVIIAPDMMDSATLLLSFACFASGASALIFEGLWFHLAGLAFGNSTWASSLVTASFMAGLALGGGLVAKRGSRLKSPLRLYAWLEALVGATGLAVVLLFPRLTPLLAPLFRQLAGHPGVLNLLRLGFAFVIMAVPATAMGATLPVVVTAVSRGQVSFGAALGWLYGWNTLGGVAGVLLGELVLIGSAGLRGTAIVAVGMNALASLTAFRLSSSAAAPPTTPPVLVRPPVLLLTAAAFAGGTLLALEVVWFRFLLLFFSGTTVAFALMLAVILGGIGIGGILASQWLRLRPEADAWLPTVALVAGIVTIVTYSRFSVVSWPSHPAWTCVLTACSLMTPGALLSGTMFTFLGTAVRRSTQDNTQAAGLLTLANTTGAMAGAMIGGFVLLPRLGIERSLLALALAYVGVALTTLRVARGRRGQAYALVGSAALLAVSALLFPFGLIRYRYLQPLLAVPHGTDSRNQVVAFREGLAETIAYLRSDWKGAPHVYRLYTNSFAMSGTQVYGQHYMKQFVYWAMAVQPNAKRALLVCYGVGNTAKALADTPTLESIDVVDISPDVLDLGHVPYPPPARSPLEDPRVRVHVEDGRFFLLTTGLKFDVITAEPPPPKIAGVVNLYSREYFSLIHDRLAEGGVATYWLPVEQLVVHETKAIVRAFCDAFPDCSLWAGAGTQWMLAGTRNVRPPTLESFTRQWRQAPVAAEMKRLGFDVPETLGAGFLADSAQLATWTKGIAPLEDDWPRRLDPEARLPLSETWRSYETFLAESRARFEASGWIREIWPGELRQRSPEFFVCQKTFDDFLVGQVADDWDALRGALAGCSLRTLPLVLMRIDPIQVDTAHRIKAGGVPDAEVEFVLGAEALAQRSYSSARESFEAALKLDPTFEPAVRAQSVATQLSAGH